MCRDFKRLGLLNQPNLNDFKQLCVPAFACTSKEGGRETPVFGAQTSGGQAPRAGQSLRIQNCNGFRVSELSPRSFHENSAITPGRVS